MATYEKTVHDHRTGRKCDGCGGVLLDSIINFGEQLPAAPLKRARTHAKKADLCLALGSSLTIPPAMEIPETAGTNRRAELVICNLQTTPLDHLAGLRIYAKTDDLMVRVMDKLQLPIPPFILRRRLVVELESAAAERHTLRVYGVDVDDTPATFLRSVRLAHNRRVARAEPFLVNIRGGLDEIPEGRLAIELELMGHYGEPNLEIVYEVLPSATERAVYLLEYNPSTGEWVTTKQ